MGTQDTVQELAEIFRVPRNYIEEKIFQEGLIILQNRAMEFLKAENTRITFMSVK